MGCGFGGADENGVGETVNDRARRARHGDGGDRRWRQCRQQHDAAGTAAIDAKLAVGLAREGRGQSEMIGMADDAARMGCITGRGLGGREACDQARQRDHVRSSQRYEAPP